MRVTVRWARYPKGRLAVQPGERLLGSAVLNSTGLAAESFKMRCCRYAARSSGVPRIRLAASNACLMPLPSSGVISSVNSPMLGILLELVEPRDVSKRSRRAVLVDQMAASEPESVVDSGGHNGAWPSSRTASWRPRNRQQRPSGRTCPKYWEAKMARRTARFCPCR